MSCFVVSKSHIDKLLTAAMYGTKDHGRYSSGFNTYFTFYGANNERFIVTENTASHIGQMLVDENYASYNYRYPTDKDTPLDYFYAKTNLNTTAEIAKALDCFAYQSCEHPGWKTSTAYSFYVALLQALLCALPGYTSAPW